MRPGLCYVLSVECTYDFTDDGAKVGAQEIASLPGGRYRFSCNVDVDLSLVWKLPSE